MNIDSPALLPEQCAIVHDIIGRVLGKQPVWLFGSRARGDHKPYSDLDLLLRGAAPLTLSQLASLQAAFEDSDLPFKVDIVDWSTAAPAFRQMIERDAVLLPMPPNVEP
jgi:type I restriction enzyme S subunit